jgi:hypothetical protein
LSALAKRRGDAFKRQRCLSGAEARGVCLPEEEQVAVPIAPEQPPEAAVS